MRRDLGGVDAEPDRGIEEPGAVGVDRNAVRAAERVDRPHMGERQHGAAGNRYASSPCRSARWRGDWA